MTPTRILRCAVGLALCTLVFHPADAGAVTRTCGTDGLANTTNVLCASPSGPCNATTVTMNANIEVTTSGCLFDLGGRALNIQKTFQMMGATGYITVVNAGNITITDTGKLKARGDFVQPQGYIINGGLVSLTGSGTLTDHGVIDVSGDSAGTIRMTMGGDVVIASDASIVGTGDTLADEGERYADGGTFEVRSTAGNVTVNAVISLPGNNQATGGSVTLIGARNVTLAEVIDATGGGGDGGDVTLIAGDDILVTKTIDVSSRVGGGFGGSITLGAGADGVGGVAPGGTLTVNNAPMKLIGSPAETSGGDGGDFEATALGLVRFIGANVAVRVDASTTFGGDGGSIYIASSDDNFFRLSALDGDLQIAGLLSAHSGNDDGGGGTIDLSAGRDLDLTGTVDANGKAAGGDVSGDAGRAIHLAGPIHASAVDVAGAGGAIDFSAGLASVATLTVQANIDATGGDNNGGSDNISLAGCGLSIEQNVTIDGHAGTNAANVSGGSDIDLVSRTPMQLKNGSQYRAYPVGRVSTFHPPGQDPIIGSGVVFNPSRTDRPTVTGGYPNCPVCGNNVRELGEPCDDGDLAGGDGCAADCSIESGYTCTGSPSTCTPTCGDGLVIAPEQCDDHNLASNDGCGPNCTVEGGWGCSGAPSVCAHTCGDGVVTAGEECDDANLVSGDGCDANCRFTGCGNGIVTTGEVCDDGNLTNGDCCSALCQGEVPGSPCGSDNNGCTNDVCSSVGTCVHVGNTLPCADDGNICTNDVCNGGTCTHPANTAPCADEGNACTNDVCGGGVCTHPANSNPCNDGNACTQTDTCSNGSCVGANPVVCTALDQCHNPGVCAPATGVCSNPAKPNNTTCNDGNACTQTDTCQAGNCTGANPRVCTALDQCHVAGTCTPATGICTNPNKADGSTCSDGNACTLTDTCQSGSCSGTPKVCTPLDQCHAAGTCAPATGTCSNPVLTGTGCNDGNVCTRADTCSNGTCVGNPNVCNDGVLQPTCNETCDDGNTTNGDGCDSNCTPTACGNNIVTSGEACDDGGTTGGDGCSPTCTIEPGWTCSGSPSHCTEVCGDGVQTPSEQCDDGNVTSRDGCSSNCRFEVCTPTPATGCKLPIESAKSSVQLKEKSTNDKDIFSWKFVRGQATPKSGYGDPSNATDYAICLYDELAGSPQLKLSVAANHGGICRGKPCWRLLSTGYKYTNTQVVPDGKFSMVLKEGLVDGATKIIVKGKGSHLLAPTLPLSKNPRVRVQLRNSAGGCWETNFSTSQLNDGLQFKAKSD